jgi:hypothetical protein
VGGGVDGGVGEWLVLPRIGRVKGMHAMVIPSHPVWHATLKR